MSNETKKPGVDELLEGHNYDGVQEFNNAAPFWWQLAFYISIVFAIGYMAYYLFLGGPSSKQELTENLDRIKKMQPQQLAGAAVAEEVLAEAATDPSHLAVGAKVFAEKCLACHAADGGGLIGPNLVDNYWIHDKGSLAGIYRVIHDGVGDKGMPAWGELLSQSEMVSITGYVKSLKGKAVANAKPPQGDKVD
jgi:cytochrome c oxidase cbb3-type subunit III